MRASTTLDFQLSFFSLRCRVKLNLNEVGNVIATTKYSAAILIVCIIIALCEFYRVLIA